MVWNVEHGEAEGGFQRVERGGAGESDTVVFRVEDRLGAGDIV